MNLFDLNPSDGPSTFKMCCAFAYESPVLSYLLGKTWRPGGTELTSEIAAALDVRNEMLVLDVASGTGETATLLTRQFGARVVGVDLSVPNLKAAAERLAPGGVRVPEFAAADAEVLPLRAGAFDAVFCECSFCTFPDKLAALKEVFRVVRPGGWLALADVSVVEGALPDQLAGAWGRVACLADAMPVGDYVRYVEQAGFEVKVVHDCNDAAQDFLRGIDSKLLLLRVGQAIGRVDTGGIDIREARAVLKQAISLVQAGKISYFYLLAQKAE